MGPDNKELSSGIIDGVIYTLSGDREMETQFKCPGQINVDNIIKDGKNQQKSKCIHSATVTHYFTLAILGVSIWGILWSAFGDGWRWDGQWFKLSVVAVVSWSSGLMLQSVTTMPPLLAALTTGILARNLGFLDMRDYTAVDSFLRKVYPVIILGKASLGWNVGYMASEWRRVAALGVLPWVAEVLTLACCTHYLLNFPWIWGFLLGSFYASVSCAVVMPGVNRVAAFSAGSKHNWPQLVCTAGGVDTALSVGVFGLIHTYMFYESTQPYRVIKAVLTIAFGAVLGICWGSLAKVAPHKDDIFVTELRVLLLLVGGLFGNFTTSLLGWGGIGGVAVLACNATAATYWERDGWTLNSNPASTAYRVMWSAFEPLVFTYTGTFFIIDSSTANSLVIGLGILLACLSVRLTMAALVSWDMTFKERLFVCCTWIPKTIVEAVLCPLAITTLMSQGIHDDVQKEYAENVVRLTVQAIVITTPIGFLLTNHLGPYLLAEEPKSDKDHNDVYIEKSDSV